MAKAQTEQETQVLKLFDALRARDANAVRDLVDKDVEWHNTGLPTVWGKTWVDRVLTAVSYVVTSYEVTEWHWLRTENDTVYSQRAEIIRLGWLALHLDIDGRYGYSGDKLRVWDDRFSYTQLLSGLRFGPAN